LRKKESRGLLGETLRREMVVRECPPPLTDRCESEEGKTKADEFWYNST